MISINDNQKIGIAITGFGMLFLFLGMILFFDKGLLAMGNIMFLCGLALIIGLERTFRFFFQRQKLKGTAAFFGGILVVLLGFPFTGMCIESYGFFVIFSGFFPVAVNFIRRIPVIGNLLNLPGISHVAAKLEGQSRTDEKEDPAVTADRKRLSDLFDTLDRSGDDKISLPELEAYLRKTGQDFSRTEIKRIMAEGDAGTKDGSLDRAEFIKFMMEHERDLYVHFTKLDRDGNGTVTFGDLKQYCRYNNLAIPEDDLVELIRRVDKDDNLQLSWAEFREFNQFRLNYDLTQAQYYGDSYADNIVQPPTAANSTSSPAKKLICGGLAGVLSRTSTAPLDRLKVLLQVQGQQKVVAGAGDLSMVQMFKAMGQEGILSMWRGNGVSCIKIFPENALRFLLFETLCNSDLGRISQYDLVNKLLSGGLTGMAIQSIMYPVELTKTRLMTSQGKVGILETVRLIAGEPGGVVNFYKGITPALTGVLPFAGLQLGLSKSGTELYKDWNKVANPGFWPLFSISSTATFVAMGCTYPLRLVTCNLQAYRGDPAHRPTPRSLFTGIFKKDGLRGFYRGFGANALKAVPASSFGWAAFVKIQKLYETYLE
eukprot:sb/3463217/